MARVAEEALRANDPKGALDVLQVDICKYPQDSTLRVFLFQLLAVLGQWERALRQLNVLTELSAQYALLAQTYRPLIACEAFRAEVFEGKRASASLGEPLAWFGPLVEALRLDMANEHGVAQELRAQGFEQASAVPGKLDGKAFEWISDADERLGPVLEMVINGRYFWVPFERLSCLEFEGPKDLRDLVWLPAKITWANGGEGVGFVPSRYAGSHKADQGETILAYTTIWPAEGISWGMGQRMLATNRDDIGLFDVRRIDLEPPAAIPPSDG